MSNQQDTKKKNPNVPNLRFSGFTEEWQTESANSLFEVIPNNTISRDGLNYESGTWKNIHYGDILTLFPTLLDVNDVSVPYISSASFSSKTALSSGDVVIADTAEDYTAGKALEVIGAENTKTVPGLHTIACHPTRTFSSGFLGYYLNSFAYRERIKPFIQGIKVYSISKGNFLRSSLSFPSIQEQAKIGSFLSLLDKRIEVQNKIIRDLESQIVAINNRFFDSLQSVALFRDLYECAGEGGTPDTKERDYYEPAEIPFIKIENLYEKYLRSHSEHISKIGLRNSSAWLVPAQCVLLSNGATIGECTITTYPVCTKQGIIGIVPSSQTSAEFLYLLFKSRCFKRKLRCITTKGTMDAAYLKDINQMIFPFCDQKEQQRHIGAMKPFEEKLEMEKRLLFCLKKEKEYLLRNLFI